MTILQRINGRLFYTCPQCGQSYTNPNLMRAHEARHRKETA